MKNLYHVIVGADQGDLFFTNHSELAHALIADTGRYVFTGRDYDGSGVMHYQNVNDYLPLKPEDTVLARRLFVDFDNMDNNELDARYHAFALIQKSLGKDMYRIEGVDAKAGTVDWFIGMKGLAPILKTTPWAHPEQLRVTTTDYSEVDALCCVHRISVTCNQDTDEQLCWTASSPYYRDMEMKALSRSRAVIQLVLWAFYQRQPFAYIGQDKIGEILKSHATKLVV